MQINAVESKAEQAYRLLEEQIVTMVLPPGAMLSETELATQLELGRTPVREALQKLAAENLVEIMPRRGIRVTEINVKQQLRLIEVRRELELLQAQLACKRASQVQLNRFQEIAVKMMQAAESEDYLMFVRLDRDMNELTAEAADNVFAENMLRQLHGLSRRFWHLHFQAAGDLSEVAAMHARLAKAIAERKNDAAVLAVNEHMDYIHSFTLATLDH